MCDKTSRREKRDERRDEKFYADASFITKKSFLRFVKGQPREEYSPPWPKPSPCVYPKANSYYAYHEDSNPFARFTGKCQSREYGNVRPHFEPSEEPHETRDPYSERNARDKYLASEPTCFAIFGKPGLNTTKLATTIADSWNSILISPLPLIKQEIQRNSDRGKLMADVLKEGGSLGPDVIANLIAARLNRRDVFHRGYVVEGLPLIPNATLDYSSCPNVVTAKEQNLFISGTCNVSNNSKNASTVDQVAGNKLCVVSSNYEDFVSSQIEDIFTTWPIKPSVIVYAMCPDEDVLTKREHLRLDPATGCIVDTSFVDTNNKRIETLFSRNRMENGANDVSFGLYQKLTNEERQGKYLLKRPSDERSNAKWQCALYKRLAMPTIEKWILLHNPQNVIRVDGRASMSFMFQIFVTRTRTLPLLRVILPRRFTDHTALGFEGESPVVADEFDDKSNEEAFQQLTNRETVSPLFPWELSPWGFLCPVELARGRTVDGLARHAVRFMNKIFFLSSNEAVHLFVENPRTFVRPFSPRPTCKIVVFGPDYSGKSALCSELARVLKGTVINVKEMDEPSDESIVEAVRNVPREEVDVEVWRDGGYIVDGLYPNIDTWKTIVDDSEITFEDAILLFDDDPYDYLLSKWREIRGSVDGEEFEETWNLEDLDAEGNQGEAETLVEYIRHVQKFQLDWETMRERVTDDCRNFVACNVGKITDVSKYVIDGIKDRYKAKARVMSEEEKERERDLAEYIGMTDTENIEEEEEEEREGGKETTEVELTPKEDNRRFGDTSYYCPVALLRYNVFWKGKEEYGAIFMDKIYHLSSPAALEEFVRDPQKLGLPLRKPLSVIPPLRVSIVGPPGSGKSTLSDAISREYGLAHVDYLHCFTTYMQSRGMQPLSYRDVLVLSNELPDEVELPEDLKDERYNSESDTILTFVRNYWKDGGTLPERVHGECLLKFFQRPYSQCGIVFDQFPSCPQDVATALKSYTVPEVIVELGCGRETASERVIPRLLESWQTNMEERKRVEQLRHATELENYERDRDAWVKEMLSQLTARGRAVGEEDDDLRGEYYEIEEEDYVVLGEDVESEEMQVRKFELEETWYQENPEPVLFTDWEDFETAERRIEREFFDKYETESRKLAATRDILKNESIPYIVLDAEADVRSVLLRVMRTLEPYVRRHVSVLERIHTIDLETADALLDRGYYLLSSFGRWCPVQLRENKVPLQMFLPSESAREIHPVVHRQFVYFTAGKDAQTEFVKSPFKYLEQDSRAPVVPFRLSIVGPPKCGKTTLARRFASKYNVKVITRGEALRHVVEHFPWTESARSSESSLRKGRTVPTECVLRAVEMYSIDPDAVSQGFVLDGFPSSRREFEELTFLGLQPMIILDLKANLNFSLECLSREADRVSKPANFSSSFLSRRFAIWEADQQDFRAWLKRFTQNVVELDATKCAWYVWTVADRHVCSRYAIIRSYFRESDYDKVHSLRYMSVSSYEFRTRQSRFESYCPLCLYYENTMKASGPPDHEGMVQYREHFYWICSQHMQRFIQDPRKYLPPVNTSYPPEDRPRVLTETIDLEHPCWAKRLRVEGFCLVTYVDSLPSRQLARGELTTAVLYRDNLYLFCTEGCRDKFLAQPGKYDNTEIKFLRRLPEIDVKSLPDLGYLEQTVSKMIIEAVNQISVDRPKLPGLSPSATAAVHIGVYLKARNASCALKECQLYKAISDRIYSRERMIKIATKTMKKMLNPFVQIPVYEDQPATSSHLPRSISIVFRRTSPTQILIDPYDESLDDDETICK
ncbi:adenylate kinase 9-like [Frieseomelitta varia]|uniref:adenylate kinase 9-like n=1 Tax=Frieseomelitta varia TaxID=561572 RepID=UPI001CB6990C|nr:adenylate kinase 9-like [Frieseomelitta varia]